MTDIESNRISLNEIQQRIGYWFKETSLLEDALTHKSFANEMNLENCFGNERLEFLGDAVLELAISHILMERFHGCSEGRLSKMRAAIVNKDELAALARRFDMGSCIRLSRGEVESKGREKKSILANAYEAVIAAVYYDGGYAQAFKMISQHLADLLDDVAAKGFFRDYKSRLQEYAQKAFNAIPEYTIVTEEGPDHIKHFGIQVIINDVVYARGQGRNKKAAEQEAARLALERLQNALLDSD